MLSIVITNYNYARFLPYAIESALRQTYPETEVIVVDDGSTDGESLSVIERYAGRIVPIVKANGGQASAVNAGCRAAHGDVVMFLDADDVLAPTIGARVVDICRARPEVSKVQFRMDIVDADGRPTGGVKPSPHLPRPAGDLRRQELTAPFDMAAMSMSANAFPRSVLNQILPIPEADYPICADFYLSHLTPFFGLVVFLDQIGASYRVHGSNSYTSYELNLQQVRSSVVYMGRTLYHIQRTAQRLGLLPVSTSSDQILSFAYLAQRLISLKQAPAEHPIAGDHPWPIVRQGIVALRRRFDLSPPVKLALAAWLIVYSLAPAPLDAWLAQQLTFPELRSDWLNSLLGAAYRKQALRRNRGLGSAH